MGDVALVSSPVEMLRAAGHEAWLLSRSPFGELFRFDDRVRVIQVERTEGFSSILERVQGRFDAVVDLHAKALSRAITCLSGARIRHRVNKRVLARRLAVWFKRPIRFVPVHELYCRAVRDAIGLDGPCPLPRLWPGEFGIDLPPDFIALAPGAQHRTRSWPWFAELGELLARGGRAVVWIGLEAEGPQDVRGLDLRGRTSLAELLFVISRASALVSGDSGPMHLARATGVPVVALFGPTVPEFGFGPLSGGGVALEKKLACRPCSLHGEKDCPKDLDCLMEIGPEEVIRALEGVLQA